MSTPSPSARAYRRLGSLALAHAALLVALTALWLRMQSNEHESWFQRFWVGSVTLWFFWPVALILHRGRSVLRFAVFMLLATIVLLPSLWFCNTIAASEFGLPWGVDMTPWSMWQYFSAYRAGRTEAEKDVAAGILAIEEYGFGAGSGFAVRILSERYQIETRGIAQCAVDEKILGHAAGYNAVSEREIDRRIGMSKVEAARKEGYKLAVEQRAREEQYPKDLAKRLSHFSSNSKITLHSLSVWMKDRREIDPEAEEKLGQFIHELERFISEAVPEDAPAFNLHVSASLTSTERPQFHTSASLSAPSPIYDRIYKNLPSLPMPDWNQDRLEASLDFRISENP